MDFSELTKAAGHKYASKKPDGKGGWIYRYTRPGSSRTHVEITEEDSPLDYKTRADVKRLSLRDPSAPQAAPTLYHEGSNVGFVDYSTRSSSRGEVVDIHYMSVRDDQRGQGHGRKLVEALYDKFSGAGEIDWGKVSSDAAEKLYQERRASQGGPRTYGKIW